MLVVAEYIDRSIFLVRSFRIDSITVITRGSLLVARLIHHARYCAWEAPRECIAFGTGQCKTPWVSHGCLEVTTSPPHMGRHRHLAHQCYLRRCVLRMVCTVFGKVSVLAGVGRGTYVLQSRSLDARGVSGSLVMLGGSRFAARCSLLFFSLARSAIEDVGGSQCIFFIAMRIVPV